MTIELNGVDFCDEGGRFNNAEGSGSKSFLKTFAVLVVTRRLFLTDGPGNALGPMSASRPLKDLKLSQ